MLSVHHYPPFQLHQTISLHLIAWYVSQLAKILMVQLKWKYFLVPYQNFEFSHVVISILNYPFSYCSSNFAEAKVVALNLFASFFVSVLYVHLFMASFLYGSQYSYRTPNYWEYNSCCSFSISKAITIEEKKILS